MITARFGFESFVSGRTRTPVWRDPMAESRIRANEMTSSITGDLVIVVPFGVEHESHVGSPFPAIAILVSKPIGIRKLQQFNATKQHQRSRFALTPLACFCDKLVNSTR